MSVREKLKPENFHKVLFNQKNITIDHLKYAFSRSHYVGQDGHIKEK